MVDFGYDFLDGSLIGSVTQHVQNGVYIIARNLAFFLCVESIKSFSQNFMITKSYENNRYYKKFYKINAVKYNYFLTGLYSGICLLRDPRWVEEEDPSTTKTQNYKYKNEK